MLTFDGRLFYVSSTAALGVVSVGTELRFTQRGARVVGRYAGGTIQRGCLVGRISGSTLLWRYVQRERSGELHAGHSVCNLLEQRNGSLRIVERFEWETRPGSGINTFDERRVDQGGDHGGGAGRSK